jgi:hypothetical protein
MAAPSSSKIPDAARRDPKTTAAKLILGMAGMRFTLRPAPLSDLLQNDLSDTPVKSKFLANRAPSGRIGGLNELSHASVSESCGWWIECLGLKTVRIL